MFPNDGPDLAMGFDSTDPYVRQDCNETLLCLLRVSTWLLELNRALDKPPNVGVPLKHQMEM